MRSLLLTTVTDNRSLAQGRSITITSRNAVIVAVPTFNAFMVTLRVPSGSNGCRDRISRRLGSKLDLRVGVGDIGIQLNRGFKSA